MCRENTAWLPGTCNRNPTWLNMYPQINRNEKKDQVYCPTPKAILKETGKVSLTYELLYFLINV